MSSTGELRIAIAVAVAIRRRLSQRASEGVKCRASGEGGQLCVVLCVRNREPKIGVGPVTKRHL